MSLWLTEGIYPDPYNTNLNYLRNMTSLQMKALKEMTWDNGYILTGLVLIPFEWAREKDAERFTEYFADYLNEKLMEL